MAFTALFAATLVTQAQTADQAWLRYHPGTAPAELPTDVVALGDGQLEASAATEMVRGLQGMYGKGKTTDKGAAHAIILGTYSEIASRYPELHLSGQPNSNRIEGHNDFKANQSVPDYRVLARFSRASEAFTVYRSTQLHTQSVFIAASSEQGVLYGTFWLLRQLACTGVVPADGSHEEPALAVRWVDEWDNPDGSIERGYAGKSIFFEGGNVRDDLAPVSEYGRLLASVGINGLNVNNVNAAPQLIDATHLKQLARVADALRPWGVRLAMSVAVSSPQSMGGLTTYDPLNPIVQTWWTAKANEIYRLIPDFAGFTVKADSEGQPGPASFGRTPADAANTLAAALAPHGGVVMYRAFVYNHHLDWHDPKADRARAAYDIFHPLDGKFAPNVIVQTKEGPIDFQVREPVSPLFAGLEHTSQAMEVQMTQEYTGQQRHLVYLAPMWKWVLDTDLRAQNRATPVREILAGKTFDQPLGGMVGVAGIGRDHWLASPLALANLYAFGRLAWDPNLTSKEIADEWTRQTISTDQRAASFVDDMIEESWSIYEDYTGPLGLQTLTDITGSHYGPNIESSERNGWGQWHDADAHGVGKDRTVATGSGFAGQYPPELAKLYENPATTPDNLLLFFHHVPYTYKLHDGKTVIQEIYDDHYTGALLAGENAVQWGKQMRDIEAGPGGEAFYKDILARLDYQAGHAIVWRDAVVQYFYKLSGIPDEQGRTGQHPGRLEAEDAQLTGYKVIDVKPWEDASGGKAVSCSEPRCTAEWTWSGTAGEFNIAVQYFDLPGGAAKFTLLVNGKPVDNWAGDANLPSMRPNGDNSTRHSVGIVTLKSGDTIKLEGVPDGADSAALDYIELERLPDFGVSH